MSDQPLRLVRTEPLSPAMFPHMTPPTDKLHTLVSTDVVKLEQVMVIEVVLLGQLPQLDASML